MDDSQNAKRIVIYGVTGSGKTTFARRVAEAYGLPFHEVDYLTWEPNWVEVPNDEQRRKITEICSGDEWVLDTMYGKWREIPLQRVQLILGLDYPRWLSFGRLIRRTFARAWDKNLICNGNVESWRTTFSRNSILIWHFKSFSTKRSRMTEWAKQDYGPEVILFKHPRDAEAWLRKISGTV